MLYIVTSVYVILLVQGYNDLGLMGGSDDPDVQSATLYLHQYASVSKVLKNYYVMPNGHSTRSALLTGKHPATLGKKESCYDLPSKSEAIYSVI